MDKYDTESLLKTCRSCLDGAGTVSLFDKDENIIFSEMLLICTSITVSEGDMGPHKLCSVCLYRLRDAYLFREQCQQSEDKLRQLHTIKEEIKMDDFDEPPDDFESTFSDCELPQVKIVTTYIRDKSRDVKRENLVYKMLPGHETAEDSLQLKYSGSKSLQVKKTEAIDKKETDKTIEELHFKDVEIMDVKVKAKKKRKKTPKQARYFCDACPYATTERYMLKEHMHRHTGEKPFKCDLCEVCCPTSQALHQHKLSHVSAICEVCGKVLERRNLDVHLSTHSGVKPFHCHMCAATFHNRMRLNAHIKSHTLVKVKDQLCHICNKLFYARDLKKHIKYHSRPLVTCNICNKSMKGNLKAHMMRHTDSKKYMCDCCTKTFRNKSDIQKHMLSHFGIKKFSCDICDRSFVHKSSLVSHKVMHSKTRDHVCDVCNQRFARSGSLSEHRRKKHDIYSHYLVATRMKHLENSFKIP